MPGLLDRLRSLYFSLEDGYYSVLDRIQKKIPVYSVVDPLDKIVPSFGVVIGIGLLLLVGLLLMVGGPLVNLFPSTVDVTLSFTDGSNQPIEGVVVTLTPVLDNPPAELVPFEKTTSSTGKVLFSIPAGTYSVLASKEGFEDLMEEKDFAKTGSFSFTLSPAVIPSKTRMLVIKDVDGAILGASSPVDISLSFACQSGSPPDDQTVHSGNITVVQPPSCVGLSVTVTANGFITKTQPLLGDTTTIQLQSSADLDDEDEVDIVPETGSVNVYVKNAQNAAVSGVQFKLYRISVGTTEILADQTLSDSVGFALFEDISPGKYKIIASKQGFKQSTSSEFQVIAGESNTINLSLSPSSTKKKLFVKILNESTQLPVSGAQVSLFIQSAGGKYIEEDTYTSDVNGVVNAQQGDFNSGTQLVVSHFNFVTKLVSNQGIMLEDESNPIPILVEPVSPKGANGSIPNAVVADVKVSDLLGFPVLNADTILFTPDANGVFVGKKKTPTNGIVRYENLPPGTYQATASNSVGSGMSAKLSGSVNQILSLPVQMNNATALVEVTVKDSLNKPVSDANVYVLKFSDQNVMAQSSSNASGVAQMSASTGNKVFIKVTKTGFVPFYSTPFDVIADNVHKINVEISPASSNTALDIELLSIVEISTSGTKTPASVLAPGGTYEFHFAVKSPSNQPNTKAFVRVNPKTPPGISDASVGSITNGFASKGGLAFYDETNPSNEFSPPEGSSVSSGTPSKIMIDSLGDVAGPISYELVTIIKIKPLANINTDKLELGFQTKSDSTTSPLHAENYTIGAPLPPQGDFGYVFYLSLKNSNQKTQVSSALPIKIEANKEYTLDYVVMNASGSNYPTANLSFTFPSGTVSPSSNSLPGFTNGQSVSGNVTLKAPTPCSPCTPLVATLGGVGTGKSPTTYTMSVQVKPEKALELNVSPTFLLPGHTQLVQAVVVDNDNNPLSPADGIQVSGKLLKSGADISFTSSPSAVFSAVITEEQAVNGEQLEITATASGYITDSLVIPISGSLNFSQDFDCLTFIPSPVSFTNPSNGSIKVKSTNCAEKVKLYAQDAPYSLTVAKGANGETIVSQGTPGSYIQLDKTDDEDLTLKNPQEYVGILPLTFFAKFESQSTYSKVATIDVQVNPESGLSCIKPSQYQIDISDGSDIATVENVCNSFVHDPFSPSASVTLPGLSAHVIPSIITPELQSPGTPISFEWNVKMEYGFTADTAITLNDYPQPPAVPDGNWHRFELPDADSFVTDFTQYSSPILIPDMPKAKNGITYLEQKDTTTYPFYQKGKKSILYQTTFIVEKKSKIKDVCVQTTGVEDILVKLDGVTIQKKLVAECGDVSNDVDNVNLEPGPHVLQIGVWVKSQNNDYDVRVRYQSGDTTGYDTLSQGYPANPQYGFPYSQSGTFTTPLNQNGSAEVTPSVSKGNPVKIGTLDPLMKTILLNEKGGESQKVARIQSYSSDPAIRVFVKDADVYAQYIGFDSPTSSSTILFEKTSGGSGVASLEGVNYAKLTLQDYKSKKAGDNSAKVAVLLDGSSSVLLNSIDFSWKSNSTPVNGLCSFLFNIEKGLEYYSGASVTLTTFIMNTPSGYAALPSECGNAQILSFTASTSDVEDIHESWSEGAKKLANDSGLATSFWGNTPNKMVLVVTDSKPLGSTGLDDAWSADETNAAQSAGDALRGKGIRGAVVYKTPLESSAKATDNSSHAITSMEFFSRTSIGSSSPSDGFVEALDYSDFIPVTIPTYGSSNPFEHAQNNKSVQRLARFLFPVETREFIMKVISNPPNACVGENAENGKSGLPADPKINFSWNWTGDNAIQYDSCDRKIEGDESDFIYCDATQFTISLVKKLTLLQKGLSANATASEFELVPSLTIFESYLKRDSFNDDFRDDFVSYYTDAEFAQPLPGSGGGSWKDYLVPGPALNFVVDGVEGSVSALPASGLYRVQIDYSDPEFFAAGSPSGTITVTFTKIANATALSNYSEFMEIPFNGLVGVETNDDDKFVFDREGYGVAFTGNDDVVLHTDGGNELKTFASADGATPLTTILVTHSDSFLSLNTGNSRGVLAEYEKATQQLRVHSSVPSPVLAEWSGDTSGNGDFYYSIFDSTAGQYISFDTSQGSLSKWVPLGSQNFLPSAGCTGCMTCVDAGNKPFDSAVVGDSNPAANECNVLATSPPLSLDKAFGFSSHSGSANKSYMASVLYKKPFADYKIRLACDTQNAFVGKIATPVTLTENNGLIALSMDDASPNNYESLFNQQIINQGLSGMLALIVDPSDSQSEGWTCLSSDGGTARVYWNAPRLREYVFDSKAGALGNGNANACTAVGSPLPYSGFLTLKKSPGTVNLDLSNAGKASQLCPLYSDLPLSGYYEQSGIPIPEGSQMYVPNLPAFTTGDPLDPRVQYRYDPLSCTTTGNGDCGAGANKACVSAPLLKWETS